MISKSSLNHSRYVLLKLTDQKLLASLVNPEPSIISLLRESSRVHASWWPGCNGRSRARMGKI
jgi:hypothetical protein